MEEEENISPFEQVYIIDSDNCNLMAEPEVIFSDDDLGSESEIILEDYLSEVEVNDEKVTPEIENLLKLEKGNILDSSHKMTGEKDTRLEEAQLQENEKEAKENVKDMIRDHGPTGIPIRSILINAGLPDLLKNSPFEEGAFGLSKQKVRRCISSSAYEVWYTNVDDRTIFAKYTFYLCNLCLFITLRAYSIYMHVVYHKQRSIAVENIEPGKVIATKGKKYVKWKDPKRHTCLICGFNCSLARKMSQHMKTHPAGEYSCGTCAYSTTDPFQFNKHLLKELRTKTYACDHCKYRAFHKSFIRKHIKKLHTAKLTDQSDDDLKDNIIINDNHE